MQNAKCVKTAIIENSYIEIKFKNNEQIYQCEISLSTLKKKITFIQLFIVCICRIFIFLVKKVIDKTILEGNQLYTNPPTMNKLD